VKQRAPKDNKPPEISVVSQSPGQPPPGELAVGWVEVGAGPCADEVVRMRNFSMGVLVAVVKQVRGYASTSVVGSDPREGNKVVVKSETTVSLSYVSGTHLSVVPMPPMPGPTLENAPAVASPQVSSAPSPESGASSPEPAPATADAGATETR